MTIRNYLFLRTTLVWMPVVGAGVLGVVWLSEVIPIETTWMAAVIAAWLVTCFAVLVPYSSARIKCPRCGKPLGIAALAANRKQLANCVNACPHCGVSFDEEMPAKPTGTP